MTRHSKPMYTSPMHASPMRPMTSAEISSLHTFLLTAPLFTIDLPEDHAPVIASKYTFPTTSESIHCVFWQAQHYFTSADILKSLKALVNNDCQWNKDDPLIDTESDRFECTVYSVLRQLKVGEGCRMEEAKSEFLKWLLENGCIRTLKKQKVFYWSHVNLDELAREVRKTYMKSSRSSGESTRMVNKRRENTRRPYGHFLPTISKNTGLPYQHFFPTSPNTGGIHRNSFPSTPFPMPPVPTFTIRARPSPRPDPSGLRKHACRFCEMGFKRYEHLMRHERSHTGERLFKCTYCQKDFMRSETLRQHIKRLHEPETPNYEELGEQLMKEYFVGAEREAHEHSQEVDCLECSEDDAMEIYAASCLASPVPTRTDHSRPRCALTQLILHQLAAPKPPLHNLESPPAKIRKCCSESSIGNQENDRSIDTQ